MIFHSLEYLIFLTSLLALYWLMPQRAQNLLLLAASYLFYGFVHPWFLIPFVATTLVDYACGMGMARLPERKRGFLLFSVFSNLALLGFFKYRGFFVQNFAHALNQIGFAIPETTLQLVLPVGISFYTFQSLSYIVDVYRGDLPPRRNLIDYALFVAFFPQLVAGPIERAERLLQQIERRRVFDSRLAEGALVLIVWGFFKKVVIADNVAIHCNKIFALETPSFPLLWVGVFAFAIQIYTDFSGYTDIARGSARLFGFELMENFRHPYLAKSPADFWRRWHLSLSTWFRDYVYIPLGGSRRGEGRTTLNILTTFLLSGFWHGANWNFVLWGAYWGVAVALERRCARANLWQLPALPLPLSIAGTFALTLVGWLLFREQNFAKLLADLALSPFAANGTQWRFAASLLLLILVYAAPLVLHAWLDGRFGARWEAIRQRPWASFALQTAAAALLFLGILLFGSETTADFIYFQF